MKIKFSPPPLNLNPPTDYLRSSYNTKAINILAIFISTLIVLIGYKICPVSIPIDKIFKEIPKFAILFWLIIIFVIIVHEFIHVLVGPKGFNGKNVYIGIYMKGFLCYAYTEEKFTKSRCLVVLLAPFIFLTIVPLIVMFALSNFNGWVYMCTIINLSISTSDIIVSFIVMRLVPSNALDVQPNINCVDYLPKYQ